MPRARQAVRAYDDDRGHRLGKERKPDRGSRMGQAIMAQPLLTSPPREGAGAGAGQAGQ